MSGFLQGGQVGEEECNHGGEYSKGNYYTDGQNGQYGQNVTGITHYMGRLSL